MKMWVIKIYVLGFGLAYATPDGAQQTIIITNSLANNAEKLDVIKGTQSLGKIRNWSFGDYAVVSSKNILVGISTEDNLIGTKTQNKSSKKFSFDLRNQDNDLAQVSTVHKRNVVTRQPFEIEGFYIGADGVTQISDLFTAVITVNGDTSDTWTLVLESGFDHKEGSHDEFYLTNGERHIILFPVASCDTRYYKDFNAWMKTGPATGLEFIENGKSVGALQHFGGWGMRSRWKKSNSSGCIVWLSRDSNVRTKLVLAAAMTALLQMSKA